MSIPTNPGVKTFQHPKALGNARASVRGYMFPVFRDDVEDWQGGETAYGPENSRPGETLAADLATGEGIIASGRLERIPPDSALADPRIARKEAYRLYWLPFRYGDTTNDWNVGNPGRLEAGVLPLAQGMRIWLPTEATVSPVPSYASDSVAGMELTEFQVVGDSSNVMGEAVEYEALVVRADGKPKRTVVDP